MITILFILFIVSIVLIKYQYNYENFENYNKIDKDQQERKKNYQKYGLRETNEQRKDRLEDEREVNERKKNFKITGYKETEKDKIDRLSDEDYYFITTIKNIIKKLRKNKEFVTKENVNKKLEELLLSDKINNYDLIFDNEKVNISLINNEKTLDGEKLTDKPIVISEDSDDNEQKLLDIISEEENNVFNDYINQEIPNEYEDEIVSEISGESLPGINLNKLYYEISFSTDVLENNLANKDNILLNTKRYNKNVKGLDTTDNYFIFDNKN